MRVLAYVLLSIMLCAVSASAQELNEERFTVANVAIRDGVTTPITVTSYSRPREGCEHSALAIPGLLHSAATWKPFAEALLSQKKKVCRVYAMDFPGQGETPLPVGGSYSSLTLSDLVSAVHGVACALVSRDKALTTIVGHSQGALLVQLLQQSLISQNEPLRTRFGVKRVVLLAPVSGEPIPWYFPTTPRFLELLSNAMVSDEVRGAHIAISSLLWSSLFFSNLDGTVPEGAPLEEVDQFRVTAPLVSTLEVFGYPPYRRPLIEAGIFGKRHRTRLTLVAFAQDPFIGLGEAGQLYQHLTEDSSQRRLVVLEGDASVHDLHLIDPERVVGSLR